jgi:hypothetical protein
MTTDSRTRYDSTSLNPLGVFSFNIVAGIPTITALRVGRASIRVSWTHQNVSTVIPVVVVAAVNVTLSSLPYPSYDISAQHAAQAKDLRQYPASVQPLMFQSAYLSLTMLLSDGSTSDVSAYAAFVVRNSFNNVSSTLATISARILQPNVTASIRSGTVMLVGTFSRLTSSPVSTLINVSPALTVASLYSMTFPDMTTGPTLRGLRGAKTSRTFLGAIFSDGTKRDPATLFGGTGGALTMSNLLVFSINQSASIVTVVPDTGRLTLWGNAPASVTLFVSVTSQPAVNLSAPFFCNLDPDVGDVDVGAIDGPPLLSRGPSSGTFAVPVRVNAGTAILSAISLQVTYDPARLIVVSVTAGPGTDCPLGWPSGTLFVPTFNDPPGVIVFGGDFRSQLLNLRNPHRHDWASVFGDN